MLFANTIRMIPLTAFTCLCALGVMGCGGEDQAWDEPIGQTGQALRPDTPGNNELFRFDPTDVVETHGSPGGQFLIHYTRMGKNAVPDADTDGSGVPDFVENVGQVYDNVYIRYHGELGFRTPVSDESLMTDNGGDGRFDVYLVDFAGFGDGNFKTDACLADKPEICMGYMVQENDYAGYGYSSTDVANRILGSHEYFHAIQAAYDFDQGSIFTEGSAVWATEKFDPSLKDFEGFIGSYLKNTDRSLNLPMPGPVDSFSYGSAIYFKFLEERYGEQMIRALWERSEDGANGVADPNWYGEQDAFLGAEAQTSFADAFVEFATWNIFTGKYADPSRAYQDGATYPFPNYNNVSAPYMDDALRVFYASTQYYQLSVDGRTSFTAAFVPPKDAPEQADNLALLLVAVRSSKPDPVLRVKDTKAGTETMNTEGADNAIIIVVNTLQSGESRKPGLCIGTPEEVEACRNTLVPPDPPPVMNPDPMDKPPPPTQPIANSGCVCTAAATDAQPRGVWALPVLGFLGLAAFTRRLRRNDKARAA